MREIALKTWAVITVFGLIFGLPVYAAEPEPPVAQEEQVTETIHIEEEKPKEKNWDELSTTEKIKRNPQNCDLVGGTEVMWGDGSCHKVSTPSVSTTTHVTTPNPVSGDCHSWMDAAGITNQTTAYQLIMKESGCNPNAVNPFSGACGIGQQLPCGKWPHTWNDPIGGMKDMQNYVMSRYGSWSAALAFHLANNWY